MAEMHPNAGGGEDAPQGSVVGTLINWAGAFTSLGLIAGLAVWGYELTMRDVAGVPVIQALEGPMRVAPDDPGGELARHQGLAVNEVAADGAAAPPPDRLVLAPPPPALTEEDLPAGALETAEALPEAEATDETEEGVRAEALALAEAIASGVEPLSAPIVTPAPLVPGDAGTAEAAPAGEEAPEFEIIPASVPGVSVSPRPAPRPAGDLMAQALAARVGSSVASSFAVDPEAIPPGTRLVQLGAFDSESIALKEWERVEERFADYLDGKGRVIQRAEAGGKTFYRLRVLGFEDIADARRFCAVLVAEDANCIPVVTR